MVAPDIVNSYQGAFGPPTKGHYEAMLFAARKTIEMNPGKEILMLYMPTAESSSKPHLKLTQEERIKALTEFCTKLKTEISYDKINFEASRIEYEIFKTKKTVTRPRENPPILGFVKFYKNSAKQGNVGMSLIFTD